MALTPQTGLWVLCSTHRNPVCLNHSQLVVDACAMHSAFHTCGSMRKPPAKYQADRSGTVIYERAIVPYITCDVSQLLSVTTNES